MQKNTKRGIKILVAVVLLGYLLRQIHWGQFFEVLQSVRPGFLVLFCLLQLVALVLSVQKWRVVSLARGIPFELWSGTKTYLVGMFLNNFFPSTIGGDVYRSRWLARITSASLKQALYTVFFERLQGLWIAVALVLVGAPFFLPWLKANPLLWAVVLGAAGCFFITLVGMWLLQQKKLAMYFRFFGPSVQRMLINLEVDYHTAAWHKGLGSALLFVLVGPILANWVLFASFGMMLPVGASIFLFALAAILSNIPLSFGNIGVKEGVYVLLFSFVGVHLELAVVVVMVSRVIQLLLSLLAVPGYLAEKKEEYYSSSSS